MQNELQILKRHDRSCKLRPSEAIYNIILITFNTILMFKLLIIFTISLFLISGCIIDKAAFIEYKVINSTNLDLDFIVFDKGVSVTENIKKYSEISLEQFRGSDDFYPYDLYDSVYVKFSDNKILKYKTDDNCNLDKSFFCSNYTLCIDKVCTFEIDSIEYKKAQ
jgi:hypothetical protein